MLKNYFIIAVRNLIRNKIYSIINISGLAIGIACSILILLYINDDLSYDKYVPDHDQIYRLILEVQTPDQGIIQTARTPPPWAPALTNDFPEVENYVRFKTPLVSWMISYEEAEKRFHEKGFYFADHTVFDFFNFNLIKGNPAEALTKPNTVVITESMAKKYFGDSDPMGKVLRTDNTYNFTITGIMQDTPKNSHISFDFLASFVSLSVLPIYGGTEYATFERTGLFPDIYTYLRLPNKYPVNEFEKKLPAFLDKYLGERIAQLNIKLNPYLQPLTSIHLHSNLDAELQANSDISYIYIFSAVGLIIIILACINYMNLATAISESRTREVGMRKVLGAHRKQLIIQFLNESIFFTLIAFILALILVELLLPVFNTLSGKELILAFTSKWLVIEIIGIGLLVGILSGSYPSLFLSSFEPITVLKGMFKAKSSNLLLRKALVISQFTVSTIFIICTGIVFSQMNYFQNKNLGFNKEQVVIIPLGDPRARQIYMTYKERILQNHAVSSVTASSTVPGGLVNVLIMQIEDTIQGENVTIEHLMVDHDFIKTLGIELIKGRDFSISFPTDTMSAFILNETAVKHFGWNNNPIDKQIFIGNFKQGRVIGVVKDFNVKSLHQRIEPLLIHIAPNPDALLYFSIKIESTNIPQTLEFLKEHWHNVYPNDPFIYSFLDNDFDSLYRSEEFRGQIFASFSLLAIFIACLGLFGISLFVVQHRTKEIGIRKIHGATIHTITQMMSNEFIKLIILANIIAWPIAYYIMEKWLQNFEYRIGFNWWIFILGTMLTIIIALLTVSFQTIRAAYKNPVDSLRYE